MKDIVVETTDELPLLPEYIPPRAPSGDHDKTHEALADKVTALHFIEVHQPLIKKPSLTKLRIAAWNLERCKFPEASAALLTRAAADICLLSEMDFGMARSGNRHTTRDLSNLLFSQFAFAVEFVELGIGSPQEELIFQGKINSRGFHGNAIISRLPFEKPSMIRLDDGSAWFSLDWHHPRIGGRNALFTSHKLKGCEFLVGSVHLENLETPEGRARQVKRILDYLDAYATRKPVIIGGDFNTSGLPESTSLGHKISDWFIEPDQYEPLFSMLRAAGFSWVSANKPDQTRRILNDGRPLPAQKRLDWFFVKGLHAFNPQTWPAIDQEGLPLSDHELITIDIELHR